MPILSKLIIWPVLLFFSFIFSIVDFSYADFSDMDMLVSEHDSVLVVDQQDRVVYSKNADKKLIPASTLKILTSLVAIHYMGSNFRYETEFYIDQYVNLKIKGYGDPLLISEIIAKIAENLKRPIQENSKKINNIVLDDSYFKDPVIIPGILPNSSEPYDAPNGALCANFNSVYFTRANDGNYISAEQQTPLLPFVLSRIKASSLDTGRIILSLGQDEAALYTGHLFRYFLQEQGIEVSGRIETGIVQKKKDRLIYTYVSEFSMEEIIKRLLYYSNNFMTNQVLITAGAREAGPPGSLEKGVRVALAYLKNVLNIGDACLVEGSGISRKNRFSAKMLIKILKEFEPHRQLMRQNGNEFYKTGTLDNIHTRAGYIKNDKNEFYRFVVLVNTPGKSTKDIMETLLRNLK